MILLLLLRWSATMYMDRQWTHCPSLRGYVREYGAPVKWYRQGKKPTDSEKSRSQCHFAHNKFNMDWPGRERGHPRWEAGGRLTSMAGPVKYYTQVLWLQMDYCSANQWRLSAVFRNRIGLYLTRAVCVLLLRRPVEYAYQHGGSTIFEARGFQYKDLDISYVISENYATFKTKCKKQRANNVKYRMAF